MIVLALLLPLALGMFFLGDEGSDNASDPADFSEDTEIDQSSAEEQVDGIFGTTSDDVLRGTRGDDLIRGGDGDDTLSGAAGQDLITGDNGADALNGDTGNDYLIGGQGEDTLNGGQGFDLLVGGSHDDLIFGGRGEDTLGGGDGMDELYGDSSNDVLFGGDDADYLYGQAGHDLLVGGHGDDTLVGDDGDDTLFGGFTNFDGSVAGQTDHTAETFYALGQLTELDPNLANNGTPEEILASPIFANFDTTDVLNAGTETGQDVLEGGPGDDLLVLGAGDNGSGGAGEDTFVLIADSSTNEPIVLSDYDHTEDMLIIDYDASGPAPTVSLTDVGSSSVNLLLDGQVVAILSSVGHSAVTLDDIRLVGIERSS